MTYNRPVHVAAMWSCDQNLGNWQLTCIYTVATAWGHEIVNCDLPQLVSNKQTQWGRLDSLNKMFHLTTAGIDLRTMAKMVTKSHLPCLVTEILIPVVDVRQALLLLGMWYLFP